MIGWNPPAVSMLNRKVMAHMRKSDLAERCVIASLASLALTGCKQAINCNVARATAGTVVGVQRGGRSVPSQPRARCAETSGERRSTATSLVGSRTISEHSHRQMRAPANAKWSVARINLRQAAP